MALLSDRFDILVDKHFDGKTTELTIWRTIEIRKDKGRNANENGSKPILSVWISDNDNYLEELQPVPLGDNVVKFPIVLIHGNFVEFSMPNRPLHNKIRFHYLYIESWCDFWGLATWGPDIWGPDFWGSRHLGTRLLGTRLLGIPTFGDPTFGDPTLREPDIWGSRHLGTRLLGIPTFGDPTFGDPTLREPDIWGSRHLGTRLLGTRHLGIPTFGDPTLRDPDIWGPDIWGPNDI
ncbi:hypothetical protein niasHS_008958 [Heterodera schachtii]|uniref:Uncharacterized protein n=1 Tax=Heterodera schachtii TaxID=97005 RepID=A0ABD2J5J2_HETSC